MDAETEPAVEMHHVLEPCDPGCPGRFVNAERGDIQRCDACGAFDDDNAASAYVLAELLRSERTRAAVHAFWRRKRTAIREEREREALGVHSR